VLRIAHWPKFLAEDHRDLTECPTTEDVRRPLSLRLTPVSR
jgi:hypothetical protein